MSVQSTELTIAHAIIRRVKKWRTNQVTEFLLRYFMGNNSDFIELNTSDAYFSFIKY